ASGQFDGKLVGLLTLHEAAARQHDLPAAGDVPTEIEIARFPRVPLDAEEAAVQRASTFPGNAVDAGEIGALDRTRRQTVRPGNLENKLTHESADWAKK